MKNNTKTRTLKSKKKVTGDFVNNVDSFLVKEQLAGNNIGIVRKRKSFAELNKTRTLRDMPRKKGMSDELLEAQKKLKEVIHFNEMNYSELVELFNMHSPHLVPIIKRVHGYVNKKIIICEKHKTPLIVFEGEVQPCLKCV